MADPARDVHATRREGADHGVKVLGQRIAAREQGGFSPVKVRIREAEVPQDEPHEHERPAIRDE